MEVRQGRSNWEEKGTKNWEAKEVRQGRSRWELKGIRKWAEKVDSAPRTSQGVSVLLRKESTLTSPSTELEAVAHKSLLRLCLAVSSLSGFVVL